jgi:hypothetical protein
MTKHTATVEFEVPEGYEWTGEIRCPAKGELMLSNYLSLKSAKPWEAQFNYTSEQYPILRKAEKWVKLTDAVALECFQGRTMVMLRTAIRHEPAKNRGIRDIYWSASDCLCLRVTINDDRTPRIFLTNELEYLETSK